MALWNWYRSSVVILSDLASTGITMTSRWRARRKPLSSAYKKSAHHSSELNLSQRLWESDLVSLLSARNAGQSINVLVVITQILK